MSEQPNALRLAKWLDAMPSSGYALPNQAATELRRLYEEVNEQARLLGMSAERELALLAKIDLLERQLGESVWNYGEKVRANQELLEALKVLADEADSFNVSGVYFNEKCMGHKGLDMAYAAIAKAKQA